jgi:hypothetical protein
VSKAQKSAMLLYTRNYYQRILLGIANSAALPERCYIQKEHVGFDFLPFYFLNPEAESFHEWIAKFMDHGLVNYWNQLDERFEKVWGRKQERLVSSNFTEDYFEMSDYVGHEHLVQFYHIYGALILVVNCVFVMEYVWCSYTLRLESVWSSMRQFLSWLYRLYWNQLLVTILKTFDAN